MLINELSHPQIIIAINALLHRADTIKNASGERFPLYRLADKPWVYSRGGSWMGGFWAGIWWLKAARTLSVIDRDVALATGLRLKDKLHSTTLHRSLIFNYGAGLGFRLLGDLAAQTLYQQAGNAIAESNQTALGFIPLGPDMGGGVAGKQTFSIDPLGSTLSLLHDNGYRSLARQQIAMGISACYAQNGQWRAAACYQPSGQFTFQHPAGDWARGQAWALLALMQAVHLFGEDYIAIAQQSVEYWLMQYHGALPPNRLSQPEEGDDPSASVIASIAMMGLARVMPQAEWLEQHALQQIMAVVDSDYFDEGVFLGHCYRISGEEEACVESPCGLFFLLAALMVADKQIDPLLF